MLRIDVAEFGPWRSKRRFGTRSTEAQPSCRVARVAMPPLRLSAIDPKEIRANGYGHPEVHGQGKPDRLRLRWMSVKTVGTSKDSLEDI